ncbi:MAG: hypothetical protein M1819_003018 [Sarea resinae]|nr:MAG: hypothetical protein M1819_003018 [Sarea resinae]
MSTVVFQKYDGTQVTDAMLQEASRLFTENYGVWERKPPESLALSPKQAAVVTVDDHLAGNAFACRWQYNDKSVLWITQLVVDRDYRERGLALGLLNALRQDDDDIYGIMSSHAAACKAAAKIFGSSISMVKLDFIRCHAASIMHDSPISYVRDARLRGNLFDPDGTSGLVSSVDTDFYVDHTEPLQALDLVQEDTEWPLGELIEGHEFLLLSEIRRRPRSKARSLSGSSGLKSTIQPSQPLGQQ